MTNNYNSPLIRPYQCFMGKWEGLCKTFGLDGNFLESSIVHVDINWIDENSWRFQEHLENLYGYGEAFFNLSIQVTGKTCYGEDTTLKITGVELTPENYSFTIESAVSQLVMCSYHYFLTPYQRRIFMHKFRDGKSNIYQIQDLTRIS